MNIYENWFESCLGMMEEQHLKHVQKERDLEYESYLYQMHGNHLHILYKTVPKINLRVFSKPGTNRTNSKLILRNPLIPPNPHIFSSSHA